MSGIPFADAAERIKGGLDIVDIIQRHVILKKSGRNYMGKCPFHNDKNPSMNVSRDKGIFKCFSCGVGGDALTFLMRIENKTYGEMIRQLADEQGVEIASDTPYSEAASVQRDTRQKILDLNHAAGRWFQEQLHTAANNAGLSYLSARYSDDQLLQSAVHNFQLGYAPAGWENLTPVLKERFDFVQANPDLLITAGISNSRDHGQGHYDRFRNRLIIPILDDKGQTVAFGGRALSEEDKPKYLNSPETTVYHKSNVLYGLHQAREAIRQSRSAIVMEGYFDVISAHLAGITEAVGSCGTAMTESHLKLLTRFGAETVYLAFDSDEAGLKAALSAISLIEPHMTNTELQVKVLTVPDGKDPDEFIRQNGTEGGAAFRALVASAQPYLAFKFDMALRGLPVETPEGRIQAANRLTPLLSGIASLTTRAEYLKLYAEKIAISEEALLLEVKRYEQSRGTVYRTPWGSPQNADKKKAISARGSTSYRRSEQALLTDNMPELRSRLSSRHITVEKNLLKLALYNDESFHLMMRLFNNQPSFTLSDPMHQEILDAMQDMALRGSEGNTSPSGNGILGTLAEKMNHLYSNKQDIIHIFAELVLMAESFFESFGLTELQGEAFKEKIRGLAQQQFDLLAQCVQQQQLQHLKANALQNAHNQVELLYEFRERFSGAGNRLQDRPLT